MDTSKIFNLEAEREILGAIINKNDAIAEVIDIIEPKDFHSTRHSILYSTLRDMYTSGIAIDITTLVDSLKSKLKEIGGITYLSELSGETLTSHNIKHHAAIVKEKSNIRTLLKYLNEAIGEVQKDKTSEGIVKDLQDKILEIKGSVNSDDGDVIKGVTNLMKKIEDRYNKGGDIQGIKTGYSAIDKTLNGLNRTDFIIIAARPSMGKTAFANNLTLNTSLKEKAKVNLFSLEMGKDQILERMMASVTNIEMENIKKGSLNDREWAEMGKGAGILSNKNLRVYDKIFSLNGIQAACKKRKLQSGLDIVIIDYLQLIQNGKSENRQQEVSDISRQLKLMAKELDCTVIALSQLSRAPEQRSDHRPMLSDLRESGGIEQDADIVMFLYRDEYYNKNTEDKNVIENIIAKNRNGEVGIIKLTWEAKYQKVLPYSHYREDGTYDPKIFKKK